MYMDSMRGFDFLRNIKIVIPAFILLAFSGNPLFVSLSFSKSLLVIYTIVLGIYVLILYKLRLPKLSFAGMAYIILIVILISILQKLEFGFISVPGSLAMITKVLASFFTLLYYRYKNVDLISSYIKIITTLAIISIPFYLIRINSSFGIPIEGTSFSSIIIYTIRDYGNSQWKNSGMFWEPGAFAGYIILGIIFIFIKNRDFILSDYRKEALVLIITLLTTVSAMGYIVLGVLFILYVVYNFKFKGLVISTLIIVLILGSISTIKPMKEKVIQQYMTAKSMNPMDVSNTRFGALKMDFKYISKEPLIGNGVHISTRYRYHSTIRGDIGHGNGMSNFIACWGIPLFLYWLWCLFKFFWGNTSKYRISTFFLIILILTLQGEQFLNYPIYLSFFVFPYFEANTFQNIREDAVEKSI